MNLLDVPAIKFQLGMSDDPEVFTLSRLVGSTWTETAFSALAVGDIVRLPGDHVPVRIIARAVILPANVAPYFLCNLIPAAFTAATTGAEA